MVQFGITERNYEITVNGEQFGIAAQYSVTNPADAGQEAPLQQWFGTVPGYSATYPVSEIDLTSIQTTNLYNTYVKTGTFVIQKKDAGANFAPMPGVGFRIFEVTQNGNRRLTLSKKAGSSESDGRYTVLYENGTVSDYAYTGSEGNVYLTLPKPYSNSDKDYYTYLIEEDVPDGYKGRNDGNPPSFKVTVDKQGNFDVLDENIDPKEGEINTTSIASPGGDSSEAVTTGVSITNQSEKLISATIEKEWDEYSGKMPATVVLTGKVGGETVIRKTITLSEGNWTENIQNELPIVFGNEIVHYMVEETKIGDFAQGSDGYNHWNINYKVPVYKDGSGTELSRTGSSVSAEDAYRVREINFVIENEEKVSETIYLDISKEGLNGPLTGAEFEMYKKNNNALTTINYGGETIHAESVGIVSTDIALKPNSDYYIREILAPANYSANEGYVHIHVDEVGQVSLPDLEEDNGIAEISQTQDLLSAILTIYDQPSKETIRFLLVDENDNEITSSADFSFTGIYATGGTLSTESWHAQNGVIQADREYLNGTYVLTETNPPATYDISAPVQVRVDDTGVYANEQLVEKVNNTWIVKIINSSSEVAPSGLLATHLPYFITLFAGLLLAAIFRRRKEEKD